LLEFLLSQFLLPCSFFCLSSLFFAPLTQVRGLRGGLPLSEERLRRTFKVNHNIAAVFPNVMSPVFEIDKTGLSSSFESPKFDTLLRFVSASTARGTLPFLSACSHLKFHGGLNKSTSAASDTIRCCVYHSCEGGSCAVTQRTTGPRITVRFSPALSLPIYQISASV
jgi:hypothetical protein